MGQLIPVWSSYQYGAINIGVNITVGQDLYTDRLRSKNYTNAKELRNIYGVSHIDGE